MASFKIENLDLDWKQVIFSDEENIYLFGADGLNY